VEEGRLGFWASGAGRPNFVGAWEIDGTTVDYGVGEGIVTLVPYFSTPSYTQHLVTQPEGPTKFPDMEISSHTKSAVFLV
jgi:hypothetical protein